MTEALAVGDAAVTVFGALLGAAWPVVLVFGVGVLGQAAVLRSAARLGRTWLAWRASRRLPIPGELWVGPTLGAVRVTRVESGDPVLWLMTFGASTEVTFEMDTSLARSSSTVWNWRAAGMTPVPHAEWDDYLKHGRVL